MADIALPTRQENIAMIRICLDLAVCDGNLNNGKIDALNRVVSFLQCGQTEVNEAESLNSAQAMLVCQNMHEDWKDMLVMLLNNVAKGDGPINSRENYCINATKAMLGI